MSTHVEGTRAALGFKIALLGIVLAALMGLGASSAMAAAPTLEPVVSAQPTDPNNTSRSNVFTVGVDPAETETITQIQCRLDPTVATVWSYCLNPAGGNYNRSDLANGLHEMQFRTFNTDGAGPVKDITWTVATPAPANPPVITAQPTDPSTDAMSHFAQTVDPADSLIAGSLQCRIDGADWSSCGTNVNLYLGNGHHTFQSRATNVTGNGPATDVVNWTVDIPATVNGAINVDDIASTRWDGASQLSGVGSAGLGASGGINAGDLNGDGVDDLAIPDGQTDGGIAQIIFTNKHQLGGRTMSGLGPDEGYRIKYPDGGAPAVTDVGDQNGDGLTDLVLSSTGGSDAPFFVVYGVSDPAALPSCDGGRDRCLDPATMSADQGYKVSSTVNLGNVSPIDFDGDGVKDMAIAGDSVAFILKGGERSGDVDLDAAVGVDAIEITGAPGIQFGAFVNGIEDVNGDGKDEVGVLGGLFSGGGLFVVTGRSLENVSAPIDTTAFTASDGFFIATAPLGVPSAANIGDMNDDGRDDLMVGYINLGAAKAGQVSVVYMPELPTSDAVLAGDDLESGDGYVFNPGGADAALGLQQASVGDIDGDGLDDQLLGADATQVNGFNGGGAAYLVKGQQPGVDPMQIGLGPEFNPDLGVAIVSGKANNGTFGTVPTAMGDIDGDGLPDFAIGAGGEANNGMTRSGSIYMIPGKSLMARPATAGSAVLSDTKATINGQVGTNGRDTDYQFEYGTSDDYGSTTGVQSSPAGGTVPVSADLSGLQPKTEYHYRLVVTNDLGLTRYGDDRTFTTAATPPPEGCAADSTLPGCPDYDYCKANPNVPACAAPKAKLSGLIVSVAQSKVKRGKKTTAKATIVNTGTAAAAGTKVCLSAPKKMIGGAKCVKVGSLGAGATKTVKFKVKVKKKAKRGKKIALKFKASASGLGSKSGKVNIKVG